MIMSLSSEIGPPSVHSKRETYNGLSVSASTNPGRTETFNVPEKYYPTEYRGYKVDYVKPENRFLQVTAPDGRDLGIYTKESAWRDAVNQDYSIIQQHQIKHTQRTMYAQTEEARTREH
jgi:hypothetical protein